MSGEDENQNGSGMSMHIWNPAALSYKLV
jgi:hypothetical protein